MRSFIIKGTMIAAAALAVSACAKTETTNTTVENTVEETANDSMSTVDMNGAGVTNDAAPVGNTM